MFNNRQAGAFRELIEKEQKARENWEKTWGAQLQFQRSAKNQLPQASQTQPLAQTQPLSQTQTQPITPTPSQYQSYSSTLPESEKESQSVDLDLSSVYSRALRVSSPRLADNPQSLPQAQKLVNRRVVRQVEVPVTKTVKVPIKVPVRVEVPTPKKIRVKRVVEIPVVDPSQPPRSALKEIEKEETVVIKEERVLLKPAWRIDEITERKVLEVEELQPFTLDANKQPRASGPAQPISYKDVSTSLYIPNPIVQRKTGRNIVSYEDETVKNIPLDDSVFSASGLSSTSTLRGSMPRRSSFSGSASLSASSIWTSNRPLLPLGLKVKESSDINGVLVSTVTDGCAAANAGIHKGDVIAYVNNKPTRNIQEFKDVISQAATKGPILFTAYRRGVPTKLKMLVHR